MQIDNIHEVAVLSADRVFTISTKKKFTETKERNRAARIGADIADVSQAYPNKDLVKRVQTRSGVAFFFQLTSISFFHVLYLTDDKRVADHATGEW